MKGISSGKRTLALLAVALILLAAVVALWISQSPGTFRGADSEFRIDDTASVTRIFMSDKNNNMVTLRKTAPGSWTVNEKYGAQNQYIDRILKTISRIEVKQPVARAAHNNIIREMAVNSVKVEIYQMVNRIEVFGMRLFPHEKLTKTYYVGGATQDNMGCYMLIEGSSEPFVVFLPGFRGFVSPRYSPMEKDWRDYNVFRKRIPEIASVRVETPETPQYSFEVKNTGNNRFALFALAGTREIPRFDTLKVLNFLSGFGNLNFEAILNDLPARDSIERSRPFIILTLTDSAGVSKTIRTFHKKGPPGQTDPDGNPLPWDVDRLYASVNDGNDFVLIQYFTFDKVLRPLPFFLEEPAERQ